MSGEKKGERLASGTASSPRTEFVVETVHENDAAVSVPDPTHNRDDTQAESARTRTVPTKSARPRKRRKTRTGKERSDDTTQNRLPQMSWDQLAASSWAGTTPLQKNMTEAELNEAVGWATHVTQPTAEEEPNLTADLPNVPLPPSMLNHWIHKKALEIIEEDNSLQHLTEIFDQSAMEAMGTALEEMITENMMPLARLHVDRCRRLEADGQSSFEDWTLPPVDAMLRLLEDPNTQRDRAFFPSSLPWGRSTDEEDENEDSDLPFQSDSALQRRERMEQAALKWCRAQELDPAFVRKNMDIYGLFLAVPPALSGPDKDYVSKVH
jgi:hypothetical protein